MEGSGQRRKDGLGGLVAVKRRGGTWVVAIFTFVKAVYKVRMSNNQGRKNLQLIAIVNHVNEAIIDDDHANNDDDNIVAAKRLKLFLNAA